MDRCCECFLDSVDLLNGPGTVQLILVGCGGIVGLGKSEVFEIRGLMAKVNDLRT